MDGDILVTVPGQDQPVAFPAGTSKEVMQFALRKRFPKAAVQTSSNGGVPLPEGMDAMMTQPQTTSQWLGFQEGAKIPLDNLAVMAEKGAGAMGIPTDRINKFLHMPSASEVRDRDIQHIRDEGTKGVRPGVVGNLVGNTPAMVATTAISRSPVKGGMMLGALNSEAPDVQGAVADTVTGGVGGKIGQVGMKGLASAVSPTVRPAVNYLLSKGINLTPGQIIGGNTHRIEDAATSMFLPFVADAQRRSSESFNIALANDALKPLNAKVQASVRGGHEAISTAQQATDLAYEKVKKGLVLMKDDAWDADTTAIGREADLDAKFAPKFNNWVKNINKELSLHGEMSNEPMYGHNLPMDGQKFKDLEEKLRREAQTYGGKNAGGPEDRKYSAAISDLQDAIRDMAARNNPHSAEQLKAVNRSYSMLARLESAAANTKDGNVTPAQYRNAIVMADNSVRHRRSAAGQALGQDMATAAETVLPRTIQDSGTAARRLLQIGAIGALTGGAHYGLGMGLQDINPLAAGAASAALLPYTRTGQKITQKILTGRQGPVPKVAANVIRAAAPAVSRATAGQMVRSRDHNAYREAPK